MYKRRRFSRRTFKKSRRGKYSRKGRRSFQSRVKRAILKTAETKYLDVAIENHQLYHNLGSNVGGLVPLNITSIGAFFNPWSKIGQGTARFQRIGDKITPRGMSLKIYYANKIDRPNTMFRLIVAVLPKVLGGSITTLEFDPFQVAQIGTLGNNMLPPADKDNGVKFLYDKVHKIPPANMIAQANGVGSREMTKVIKLWVRSKRGNDITFASSTGSTQIINKPLAIYVIPYEQYSTLTTDNVASLTVYIRLYYKDV